jgi:hypothetical protein
MTYTELIDGFSQIEKFDRRIKQIYLTHHDLVDLSICPNYRQNVRIQNDIKDCIGLLFGAQLYINKKTSRSYLVSEDQQFVFNFSEHKKKNKMKFIIETI